MTLVRWRPREVSDVHREIDHLVNTLWGDFGRVNGAGAAWSPTVDATETEDKIVVSAELPGLSREDIKITLKEGVLTIEGEKQSDSESKEENPQWTERRYGKFSRSFNLPSEIDAGKVSAVCKDGVLKLTLPKAEEAKPKEIEVKVS